MRVVSSGSVWVMVSGALGVRREDLSIWQLSPLIAVSLCVTLVVMPARPRPSAHASAFIVQRIKILPKTARTIGAVAKSLGIRYRATGVLLDMCADLIAANAASMSRRRVGYGSVPPDVVKAIRRSKDKIAAIASEHRVSEAMVCRIRSRTRYAWVK